MIFLMNLHNIFILDNLLTDEVLVQLLDKGILTEQLKEVIGPLAHRLLILDKMSKSSAAIQESCEDQNIQDIIPCNTIATSSDGQVKCTNSNIRHDLCSQSNEDNFVRIII